MHDVVTQSETSQRCCFLLRCRRAVQRCTPGQVPLRLWTGACSLCLSDPFQALCVGVGSSIRSCSGWKFQWEFGQVLKWALLVVCLPPEGRVLYVQTYTLL